MGSCLDGILLFENFLGKFALIFQDFQEQGFIEVHILSRTPTDQSSKMNNCKNILARNLSSRKFDGS